MTTQPVKCNAFNLSHWAAGNVNFGTSTVVCYKQDNLFYCACTCTNILHALFEINHSLVCLIELEMFVNHSRLKLFVIGSSELKLLDFQFYI